VGVWIGGRVFLRFEQCCVYVAFASLVRSIES